MNLLDLVGNTPLIDLSFLYPNHPGLQLFAKAEWMNPGGSLKDRPVKQMLCSAVEQERLIPGKIILDSSSGNAGISYSMIGAAMGYDVTIVIPGNASQERKLRLIAHGATLVETDALEGYDEALRHVHFMYEAAPEKYFFCDQYTNTENINAHYFGTAAELIEQVPCPITHFVGGVGTGGSLTGIARRLKENYPDVKIIAVRPERWPGIEGLKPLGEPEDIVPKIFEAEYVDQWVDVSADEAKGCCLKLAHYGYFVGQSSGAYLAACNKVATRLTEGTITTLLCDLGERYFSAGLWAHGNSC
ncbi:PLP-dependent cysteine synthase family protein [Photobacterium sp. SDRW27]|uniref:PLP-dependent cysteine synthase family protein n=1 Tax=Photobacterium obscurum TaxID=2829490 RepID=UPI002242CD32|nr:PLP-dependent cysteine synthase family protein [Photobacterium obscurum]MCW8328431.1 PLP-dependent cysteine synthase family protein [Photobacterium obscurum]